MRYAVILIALLTACVAMVPASRPWQSPEAQHDYLVPSDAFAHTTRPSYEHAVQGGELRVGMSMAEVQQAWGWPALTCVARRVHGDKAVILWGYHPRSTLVGLHHFTHCFTTGITLTFDERGVLTGWNQ